MKWALPSGAKLVPMAFPVLVGAGCAATDVSSDMDREDLGSFADLQQMQPSYTPMPEDAPTGEAEDRVGPISSLLVEIACHFVAAWAARDICKDDDFWRKYCPPGETRVIQDTMDKTRSGRISCDGLRELACDLNGTVVGIAAFKLLCGPFLPH